MPEPWDEYAEARTRELRWLVLQVALSSKQTHEQIAATLDRLAEVGRPEEAARRRELAARARQFAEIEARHIAALERHQLSSNETDPPPGVHRCT